MLCERCGAANPQNAGVCLSCGAPMPPCSRCAGFADILTYESAPAPASANQGYYPEPVMYAGQPERRSFLDRNCKTLLGASAVICAVLLVFLIISMIARASDAARIRELEQMLSDSDASIGAEIPSDSSVTSGSEIADELYSPIDTDEQPEEQVEPPISDNDEGAPSGASDKTSPGNKGTDPTTRTTTTSTSRTKRTSTSHTTRTSTTRTTTTSTTTTTTTKPEPAMPTFGNNVDNNG